MSRKGSSRPKLYRIYINTLYKDIYTLYVLVQVNQIYVIVPSPPKLYKNIYVTVQVHLNHKGGVKQRCGDFCHPPPLTFKNFFSGKIFELLVFSSLINKSM